MTDTQNCWKWKVEPVSPLGFPDLDSEVAHTWGLFDDDDVRKKKKPYDNTTHKQERLAQPTRAEVASKLLQDLDEWIKEGMCLYLISSCNFKHVHLRNLHT
jgi:hypothetical protein